MNKILLKIIKYLFASLCFFIVIIYISLNYYVCSKAIKVAPEIINAESTVDLMDEQVLIMSYLYANKKSGKFDKLPLLMDTFTKKNQIAYIMAPSFIENSSITMTEWRFVVLGTKRYIEKKINYKDCCNYICSKFYFGHDIYGLNNAAYFYFDKDYKDLTQEEFIKILLPTLNPVRYDILKNNQIIGEKVLEIQNEINYSTK